MNPSGNGRPGGLDSSMKISANFIHFFLPQKATFQSCLAWPPSRWPSFEHSSTKMGSLDIDLVYSTLCPSITSMCSTSKFHLNMLQYSVSGLVMLDAFTYGKDCTLWLESLGIDIINFNSVNYEAIQKISIIL